LSLPQIIIQFRIVFLSGNIMTLCELSRKQFKIFFKLNREFGEVYEDWNFLFPGPQKKPLVLEGDPKRLCCIICEKDLIWCVECQEGHCCNIIYLVDSADFPTKQTKKSFYQMIAEMHIN
jgi:hypothetical protein